MKEAISDFKNVCVKRQVWAVTAIEICADSL